MKKKENIIMGLGVLLLIVSIVGVSYAAFSYTGAGSKVNTITTGIISMSYTESDNVITIDKALPTTDDTGKVRLRDGEYFDFTVSSTIEGNAIINYEVAAEALSSNTFDGRNVKLYLTKITGTTEEEIMLPKLYIPRTTANTKTGRPEGMLNLVTGSMGTSETIKYRLRMYVKEGYNPQDDNGNEVFQVKINVYGKVAEEVTGTLIKSYDYQPEPARTVVDDNNYVVPMTNEYLSSDIDYHDTEYAWYTTSIVTKDNNEIPETAIASWDISEAGDGKAVAYYEENGFIEDEEGVSYPLYKLTLGGEGGLLSNPYMSYYFFGFSSAKTIDLTYLDTSNATNMVRMFSSCSSLTTLDLSNFDTSNVTNMVRMFSSCSSLTTLDLSNFDTSNVTNMSYMFSSCSAALDLSSFDTSNVTNMSGMFSGCSANLDLSSFDTSNVTNMNNMFSSCSTTNLDLSSLDTLRVTTMERMFSNCSATSLDLSSFDTSNVTNMYYMFSNCSTNTLDLNNFNTSNVTTMNGMFYGCSAVKLDLSGFDTSNVTNMESMFQNCTVLTTLDLTNFNTSNVTDMYRMFEGCSSITSLNISNFDTSKVTNMSRMFKNCSATIIDLSSFNTSNVTNMWSMFEGCSSVTSLDLTSFDTSKVKDMESMFQNCTKLKTITVSNKWTMSSVSYRDNMFTGCGTSRVTIV